MTPATLEPAQARAAFPLATSSTYLDVASRAPMSDQVLAALEAYQHTYRTRPLPKDAWLEEVERIRARVAALLRVTPEEIAFTKSTSDGVNIIAQALALAPGENVVVCPQIEHTNNLYPWWHLREAGVEVRTVDAVDHAFPLERAMGAMDAATRVVALSSTSFVTGARADLAAVAAACHERGVFLMVDGVQEAGAQVMDLPGMGVDALAAATQKMLLGSYGLGVLYCRADHADRLRPPALSRMGVRWEDGHEADLATAYRYRDGAPRFEVGNPNFAGLFALDGALELIEAVGLERIDQHVHTLARRLVDGLHEQGVEVLTPREAHAGLVVFRPSDLDAMVARLNAADITVAVRRGALRASFHVYNDTSDVDRLLAVVSGG